jgi:membrane-associated phospholipid phosphatase
VSGFFPKDEAREATIDRAALGALFERLALYALAVLGACFYFWTGRLVNAAAARPLATRIDAWIPFLPLAQFPYFFYEAFLFLPLVMIRDLRLLRRTIGAFLALQLFANAIFVVYPVVMIRPLDAVDPRRSFVDWTVGLNYFIDAPWNCFPSLHVANSVFIALLAARLDRAVGRLAWGAAIVIAASTMLAKHHWAADVAAGAAIGAVVYRAILFPGIPKDARREDLTWPRAVFLAVPAAYVLGLAVLFVAYRWGWRYPWPPAM